MKRLSGATALALAMAALGLAACHGDNDNNGSQTNSLPSFISGSVRTQTYDGSSDDLLTAGLGKICVMLMSIVRSPFVRRSQDVVAKPLG